MLACIPSATLHGVDGRSVTVEVHASAGLPSYSVVGLPDAAVRESRDRVRAALLSSKLPWPSSRVTVNLAPGDVRKGGSGLDLPIAIGLLVASGGLPPDSVGDASFVGELGLDGSVRPVPGIVSLVAALPTDRVVVPAAAAGQAALVAGERVRPASSLRGLVDGLLGSTPWPPVEPATNHARAEAADADLADVRGQGVARRALEVSAAGGHHLLFVGPPGSGKTMLASRLPGILPPLARDEALDVIRIHSAAGLAPAGGSLPTRPPFRAPHHSSTEVSLIGGGTTSMRPGEISLAHTGVLFLDELGEFPVAVLDMLRQPMEEGLIRIRRARGGADLPARFLLVGAMNPCPCGEGTLPGSCRCTEVMRARYLRRLSGPLLDRFDLAVHLAPPDVDDLLGGPPGEPTAAVAERVAFARLRAATRGARCNAQLASSSLADVIRLAPDAAALLERRLRSGALSARGLDRVRRVARTIADLDGAGEVVGEGHVAEAVQLRAARTALAAS